MADVKTRPEHSRTYEKLLEDVGHVTTGIAPGAAVPIPIADTVQFSMEAMKHWLETAQEMAFFYNNRLTKDFGYLAQLGTCHSAPQLADLWCRMASETVHDYADQFEKVMAINIKAGVMPGRTST